MHVSDRHVAEPGVLATFPLSALTQTLAERWTNRYKRRSQYTSDRGYLVWRWALPVGRTPMRAGMPLSIPADHQRR